MSELENGIHINAEIVKKFNPFKGKLEEWKDYEGRICIVKCATTTPEALKHGEGETMDPLIRKQISHYIIEFFMKLAIDHAQQNMSGGVYLTPQVSDGPLIILHPKDIEKREKILRLLEETANE